MKPIAMMESGADVVGNADWLSSPPDHILCAFGQNGNLIVANSAALDAVPRSRTPDVPQSRLLTIEQMLAAPPIRYIVRDLLPERGLAAIYGAPAAGKSFLAIDLAFAIASGRSHWFDRPLIQTAVAYVSLEGNGGMRKRIKACLAHTGNPASSNLRFFVDRLSLLDGADTERLASEITRELGAGTLVIIDTLSRASSGGDENSSIDMTTVIENAELLGRFVEGPVILVHHTGKDPGKGLRGHSSLLGAVDVSLEVVNTNGARLWTLKKNKDGEAGSVYAFDLVSYPVETDQWGCEEWSCAVRPLVGNVRPPSAPLTGKNRIAVMAAIRQALQGNPAEIGWGQAISVAAAALTAASGRRNTVAKGTLKSLITSGHLQQSGGKICLP